jgi:hypothetical protein
MLLDGEKKKEENMGDVLWGGGQQNVSVLNVPKHCRLEFVVQL